MQVVEIKRISPSHRKDPLTDLETLNDIGQAATRVARKRAFSKGVSITIAENGKMYRVHPSGRKELIKRVDVQEDFPRIEDDLCLA